MKAFLLLVVILSATSITFAQVPSPTPTPDPQIATEVTYKDQNKGLPKTSAMPPIVGEGSRNPLSIMAIKANSVYERPDAATRRKRFINSTIGPFALGRMVATAGISTWRNSPEEWGTKWEGFGRRVASNVGKNAIKQTAKFGLDEALKYDSHFYRSDKSTPFGTRLTRALLSPVTAKNKKGTRVVGIPNLVGTYTSSVIAYETWYPKRYDWKDGVKSGTISLGFNAAFNVFKEFMWRKK